MSRQVILLAVLSCLSVPGFSAAAQPGESTIIEHGPRNSHKIALTFDACPTGRTEEYDEKIVEVLLREKVPATLFMSGRWVEKNPDKAKFLAAQAGFEVAAHSYFHPHMTEQSDERGVREFSRTQAVIRTVTGKTPRYFRPPYGEVDGRVAALASDEGLVTIQYDVASGDPDPNLSAAAIARGVLTKVRGGSIVVFHLNKKGVRTAEAMPEIIKGLRDRGFELVTVGELLKDRPNFPIVVRRVHPVKVNGVQPLVLRVSHPYGDSFEGFE